MLNSLSIAQEENRNNYNDMKSDYFDDSDVSEATEKQLHELFGAISIHLKEEILDNEKCLLFFMLEAFGHG